MAAASWYHRDISRVVAEELLAKAGRDGCFLVRDSESIAGAYALCLLFQRHVHTYRILPDEEGLLSVQTIQGIQAKCFRSLPELISAYQQPNNGLVTPLLYPVHRLREAADEDSDGEDGRGGHVGSMVPAGVNGGSTGPGAPPTHPHISQQLQLRLQEQVHSSPSSDFMGFMADYLAQHLPLDLAALRSGHPQLRHLSAALVTACRALHSEIDFTLAGLETLARVFDPPVSPRSPAREQGFSASSPDLELLLSKISAVNHLLSSLEKKVLMSLQDTVSRHNLALPSPVSPLPDTKPMATQCFEVKVGKSQRAALTVDVEEGTVTITKRGGGSPEEVIPQDKILQLIKYQSVQSKVRLVYNRDLQRSLSKDFVFPSAKKREAFCQLLQLMKIQHSNLDEPDLISIYVGTWNMGSTPPPRSLASWLTSRGLGHTQDETTACIPHDIYVIGTQENSLGDREWVDFLRASLKTLMAIDYQVVALQCLWSIKMVVLVKPEHKRRISHVHTSSVKTGIANTLGNKGAVGVSFLFNGTSFGFVNCHLASGSEKTHRRNQNYSDILRSLALGDKRLSAFDLTLRFTHLFWFGDLNYRLDMDVQDILTHITKKEFDVLLAMDQLNLEREKNKVFLQFREGDISFPPTYRYERGSRDSYMWQKFKTTGMRINVPSWCDRILWKSLPETHLVCSSYGCTDDIVTSDHSPVFATFEVGVTSQFVPKKAPGTGPEPLACIEWDSIEVIVKTASRSKCYIEFHSYCLEEAQRSGENTSQSCDVPGFLRMCWSAKQLPVLNPILPDLEYLGDQHLLLSIKGTESCESYGECCIAMRSMIGSMAQQFETFLFHRGEETGSMRGWMKVRVPKDRRSTRERLYEWISFEEEEEDAPAEDSPLCPKPLLRSRPRSLPEVTSSYTNPAYFIFEGLPATWALGADTQEYSPMRGPPQTRAPLPSPCRSLLSPPGVGRQKRPKSAVLARDVPEKGDCSLTALHMATCMSQLERMAPRGEGDGHQMLLHQSHSAPQPPPPRCRGVPGHRMNAHQHGHHREWCCGRSCSAGTGPGHAGVQQCEEGLCARGWDSTEVFSSGWENMDAPVRMFSLAPWTPTPTPWLGGNTTATAEAKCVFNEEFKFILLPISYGIVFVVGLPLNSWAMWIFVSRMRPWNATTTYMFNLAISDTLYVFSLPTLVYYYADRNNWPFGEVLCKIVRFLFYANLYSSILFLTCISVHRYMGICHPIRSLKWVKTKHARLICVGVWLVVTICLIPNLIFVTTSSKDNSTLCHDTTKPEEFDHYVHYSSSVMALLFGIPFLVIVVCYCLMAKRLCKPSFPSPSPRVPSYKKRSIKMIIIVLTVFAICFVPFHITRTLYYTSRYFQADCQTLNIINFTYKITRPLASINSCLDPILYFMAGDKYRGRLRRGAAQRPRPVPTSLLSLVAPSVDSSVVGSCCNSESRGTGTVWSRGGQ